MERGKGITTRADLSASSQNLRPENSLSASRRPSVRHAVRFFTAFVSFLSLFLADDNRVTEQRLYITLLYRNPYEARKSIESRGRRNPGRRGGNRREIIARSSLLFHFSPLPYFDIVSNNIGLEKSFDRTTAATIYNERTFSTRSPTA